MADGITTTFSDNVEITAEDMKNIALDLGASEFAGFSADVKFGNTALNSITATLVSKGILNIDDRCKCTLGSDGKTINVAPGVAVFGDGSKIKIKETQTVDAVADINVYLKNDTVAGRAMLESSLDEPDTGNENIVMLCTEAGGILVDRRTFAEAKVVMNTSRYVTRTIESTTVNNSSVEKTIQIPEGDYNYIIFPYQPNGMSVFDINNKQSNMLCYDTTTGYQYKTDNLRNSETPIIFCPQYSTMSGKYSYIRFVSISKTEIKLKLESTFNSETFNQTFLLI